MSEIHPLLLLFGPMVADFVLTALWVSAYWSTCIPIASYSLLLPEFDRLDGRQRWPKELWLDKGTRLLVKPKTETRALVREPYQGVGSGGADLFFVAEIKRATHNPGLVLTIKLRWLILVVCVWAFFIIKNPIVSSVAAVIYLITAGFQYRRYKRAALSFVESDRSNKREDHVDQCPNQSFQADRDPRERGSRPLNSNR